MFGSLDAVLTQNQYNRCSLYNGGKGQDLVKGGEIVHVVAGAS